MREGASGDGQAVGKSAEGTGSLQWGSAAPTHRSVLCVCVLVSVPGTQVHM